MLRLALQRSAVRPSFTLLRYSTTTASTSSSSAGQSTAGASPPSPPNAGSPAQPMKNAFKSAEAAFASAAAADQALMDAMEERSGGGLCATELEGGKQVGLKRGVKENMFRVI